MSGKGMVPDTKKEASVWVRNYEEVAAEEAPTVPIKVGGWRAVKAAEGFR